MRTAAIVGGTATIVAVGLAVVDLVTNDRASSSVRFDQQVERVELDVANGDVDIAVPGDAPHSVAASSDGGSIHIDIATDPDSPYSIDAHANGGRHHHRSVPDLGEGQAMTAIETARRSTQAAFARPVEHPVRHAARWIGEPVARRTIAVCLADNTVPDHTNRPPNGEPPCTTTHTSTCRSLGTSTDSALRRRMNTDSPPSPARRAARTRSRSPRADGE